MSHTPTPWEVVIRDEDDADINATRKDGWYVTLAMNIGHENARRIVACVNACAGISTENLEQNLPLIHLARQYNVTLRDRDDLASENEILRAEISAATGAQP